MSQATGVITATDMPCSGNRPLLRHLTTAQPQPRQDDRHQWLLWTLVTLGVALRAAQYLSHQSLWGDEAYLLLNLRVFGMTRLLTGPLDAAAMPQSCPPIVLLIIKSL